MSEECLECYKGVTGNLIDVSRESKDGCTHRYWVGGIFPRSKHLWRSCTVEEW